MSTKDRPEGEGGPWSPAVRQLLVLHDLDPATIPRRGRRLTRNETLEYLNARAQDPRSVRGVEEGLTNRDLQTSSPVTPADNWQLFEVAVALRSSHQLSPVAMLAHALVRSLALSSTEPAAAGRSRRVRLQFALIRAGRDVVVDDAQDLSHQGLASRLDQERRDTDTSASDQTLVVVIGDVPRGVVLRPRPSPGAMLVASVGGEAPRACAVVLGDGDSAIAVRVTVKLQVLVDTAQLPLQHAAEVLGRLENLVGA